MHKLQLTMLPGEYWYGGHTNYGYLMPVNAKRAALYSAIGMCALRTVSRITDTAASSAHMPIAL